MIKHFVSVALPVRLKNHTAHLQANDGTICTNHPQSAWGVNATTNTDIKYP